MCPLAYMCGTAGPIFTTFIVLVPCGRGLGSNMSCTNQPVLWMMSRLAVMGHMAYFNTGVEFDVMPCFNFCIPELEN